jgi:transcriptional regulator with XRE-family HTH domain
MGDGEAVRLKLRRERIDRGWSVEQAAEKMALARSTLHRAESGGDVQPRSKFAIASTYDLKPSDIWPVER